MGGTEGHEDSVQAVQGLKPELRQHWGTHSAVPGPREVPDGCSMSRPQMGKLRHRAGDVPPVWKATEESRWSHCSAHSPAWGQQERVVPGEEGRVLCESIKQQRGGQSTYTGVSWMVPVLGRPSCCRQSKHFYGTPTNCMAGPASKHGATVKGRAWDPGSASPQAVPATSS